MGQFFRDIKSVLGFRALKLVVLRTRENDLLGLAGQLAYFFLLSFFPFLIFLVALAGLALNDPESVMRALIGRAAGFLPADAAELLVAYIDRTLRGTTGGVLVSSILATLWLGSAASISIAKAANRAYGLQETRPFWKVRGIALLMALGFTVLIAGLTLVVFEVETYVRSLGGPLEDLAGLWKILRWALAFVVVTFALDVLYYVAPNARLSFKWITPGGLAATVLMFALSAALSYYVSNLGSYNRIYGQVGAVIVFMLWLYVTGLTVLVGVEVNAVLALMAQERKGVRIVRAEEAENTPE